MALSMIIIVVSLGLVYATIKEKITLGWILTLILLTVGAYAFFEPIVRAYAR